MYSLLFLTLLAAVLSLALTPVIRALALRRQWVDLPDGVRKNHPSAIPRLGGVAIAAAYAAAFAIWLLTPLHAGYILADNFTLILGLLPAPCLILILGIADDIRPLQPWKKLAGQTIISVLAFALGLRITTLAGHEVGGIASFAVTVFWLLLCMNAFNLIDGMDGLASGIAFFATLTILVMALLQDNVPLALATAPLAGALLGFLRYNAPPASIFLGDSGSLLTGFLLGAYAIVWSQKCATLLGLTAPVMAFAVPILDVALAVARRFLRGTPIFGADRGHIHHRLLDSGISRGRAVLLLYAAGALAATFSLLQTVFTNRAAGVITVMFCALVWFGVQSLGYVEFRATGKLLRSGSLRRFVSAQIRAESIKANLAGCRDLDSCWTAIEQQARLNGFQCAEASLLGRSFGQPPVASRFWSVQIPLPGFGALTLYRAPGDSLRDLVLSEYCDLLQSTLTLRLEQLSDQPPMDAEPQASSPAA
jgi:UDP-GlcNAc:undecaprenyl-phosphate GlcNAc-1-phosphate transferase